MTGLSSKFPLLFGEGRQQAKGLCFSPWAEIVIHSPWRKRWGAASRRKDKGSILFKRLASKFPSEEGEITPDMPA